jgi:peroxiredoxin
MQLGQLQSEVGRLRALGAEVFAISKDNRADAQRMATQAGLDFPVLSDPSMEVISGYGMQSRKMLMADMGYVLIDTRARIRVRRIDRQFGEHASEIVEALRRIT